ncbi:MAG: hypothetical protein LQ338_000691 [Usnochroma carphineum]|nr:MAG: hypothetical protein LQ338_000691 [Usnochroma carphineum]
MALVGDSTMVYTSTATRDLLLVTDSPGPPTIQPGIPALQPSIPTSGVASLSIPPMHQTSSSRVLDTSSQSTANPYLSGPAAVAPSASILPSSAVSATSALAGSGSGPSSTTTSIPFLSELMSQLFSQSSTPTVASIPTAASSSSSVPSQPVPAGTPLNLGTTALLPTPPAVVGNTPTDGLPVSMNSVLVYSLSLPPYSNGPGTSEIVETMTASSCAEEKTHQTLATVYSYSLPPYTPKVPTYVATSAGIAPVSMTSGAPGNPTGNAPATRVFLQQGSVDPTKDAPAIATSTIIPLYSPACLGNAYGGGYVITPTMSVPNTNATGVAIIPPAYGFTYKLEPTQSPAYSAAVIVAGTTASLPLAASLSSASPISSGSSAPLLGGTQPLQSITASPTTATTESLSALQNPGTAPSSISNRTDTPRTLSSIPTTAITGVLSIVPTPGTVLNLSLAPAEGSVIAPDKLSSIASALVDGLRSTGPLSSDVPAVAVSSAMPQSDSAGTSCTTITTMTTSMLVITSGAPAASVLAPGQLQREAATFNSSRTASNGALAADNLGSGINGTFTSSGNGLDLAAYQGGASSFNVSSLLIVTMVLGICIVVGNNMNFDEWSC